MAVTLLSRTDPTVYYGLSSDTKPDAPTALSKFFETDTKSWFFWDGAAWATEVGPPVYVPLRPGEDSANNVQVVEQGQYDYETVAASQTDQVLGVTGAAGDFLHKLICVVTTAATAVVQIKDGGGSAITVFPNSPGGGVGTYVLDFNIVSTAGAWKVTTGAGVAVIGIGRFTA